MKLAVAAVLTVAVAASSVVAFDEVRMLCLVNKERGRRGLPYLGLSSRLCSAARKHSEYQADRHRMSHTGYDGSDPARRIGDSGYDWKDAGENIAYGYVNEEDCMRHWMDSPQHKDNILSEKFTHFGCGVGYTSDNQPYYTQDFAGDGKRHNFPECPDGGDYGDYDDDDYYGGNSRDSYHDDDDYYGDYSSSYGTRYYYDDSSSYGTRYYYDDDSSYYGTYYYYDDDYYGSDNGDWYYDDDYYGTYYGDDDGDWYYVD